MDSGVAEGVLTDPQGEVTGVLPDYAWPTEGYSVLSKGQRCLPMKRVWERGDADRHGLRLCGRETS